MAGGDFNIKDRFNDHERTTWDRIEKLPEDKKKLETKRIFLREFFKKDFRSFVYLVGYRDLGEFHLAEIERLSKVRILDDTPVRRLWLWSRGFFKTSLITEAHSIWLIVNNVNIRILIPSFTISISEDIVKNIKNCFTNNEAFRWYFKEFCPRENTVGKVEFGTSQEFTVPNRTRQLKEPTVMAAGVGTNVTGLHFDYIKPDDLVTKDSVTNETQIKLSKDYYGSLRHLFDRAAVPREDVTGTIYHFNDLHCLLKSSSLFEVSFIPAKIGDRMMFPERLTEDKIQEMIADPSIGIYQVQTQYFLNPINPADAKFKEEWLEYYETINTDLMAQYILCDPASTQKKKSDYTVIERWGIDNDGFHNLIEGIRDKLTAFQRIDKVFEMVRRSKNLKWLSYEVIGGRHGDLEVIKQRQMKEQLFFLVRETKASQVSKADRIEQRLVPIYHNRIVKLPRESNFKSQYDGKVYNFTELLKLEYLQFPFNEHDDILDCQSQIMEEQLIKGEKSKKPIVNTGKTADYWDQMYKLIDKGYTDNPGMDHDDVHKKIFYNRMRRIVRRAV